MTKIWVYDDTAERLDRIEEALNFEVTPAELIDYLLDNYGFAMGDDELIGEIKEAYGIYE